MSVFLQLPTDPRDPASAALQRRRFHDHVVGTADRSADRVVILEPNPALASALSGLWSDWPTVEIRDVTVIPDAHPTVSMPTPTTVTFTRAVDDGPDFASMGPLQAAVRRRFPNSTLEQVEIPAIPLTELLIDCSEGEVIRLLAISAGTCTLEQILAAAPDVTIEAIAVAGSAPVPAHLSPEDVASGARLGFAEAGRPWGEAGEAVLLRQVHGAADRTQAALAQARIRLGAVAVEARDGWLGPARRHGLATRVRARLRRGIEPTDILDPTAGHALPPISRAAVESAIAGATAAPPIPWQVQPPLSEDPWNVARECHVRHGVWPISFSYPRPFLPIRETPAELIGPITPGLPYSFVDEREYLNTYADAYWGLTHRKAGWDCFRHVEIMASGALPWMLDAPEIPRYSMVHYPKRAMTAAAEAMAARGIVPEPETRAAFRDHLEQHLTSLSMAQYLLKAAGLQHARSVVFVDARLPHHADYQSMLTLIGLKQLLGPACQVQFPVDYIYDDTDIDVSALYGRGFGYTRVVSAAARSSAEVEGARPDATDVDAVVIGSITRNEGAAATWLERFPAERTIWIHGEDLPPSPDEVAHYRRSRVHMFVRAIHVDR